MAYAGLKEDNIRSLLQDFVQNVEVSLTGTDIG